MGMAGHLGIAVDDNVADERQEARCAIPAGWKMEQLRCFVDEPRGVVGGQEIGIQHDLAEAIATAKLLGSDIVKVSMDLIRPRPVAASRFHSDVMAQIKTVASRLKQMAPVAEIAGVKIAVENHCDTFRQF